jgi:HAD superfamily hydrolase (TIGR01509 family)
MTYLNAQPTTRPFAVLWDFDGTIADTEPLWIEAEIEMMGALGVPWTDADGRKLSGVSGDTATAAQFAALEAHGVDTSKLDRAGFNNARAAIVARKILKRGIPWRPGARELLQELLDLGIPCALVSASPMTELDAALPQFEPGWYQTLVHGDSVTRQKPAPDGYLMAAGRLGFAAADCLVIEDSLTGTASGRASGAPVLAVPCMTPLPEHPGQVNLDTLAGVTFDTLTNIHQQISKEREAR